MHSSTTASAERVTYATPLRIVYLGNLSATFNDTPLLGRLSAKYPHIDVYGGPPPDPELRFAAMCSKGDNLTAMGRKDATQLDGAVAAYEALAALPEVTPVWRNQALYKKGQALEQLGRQPEAVTAYYDVLDKTVAEGREFFWFYKAGFAAAHFFEEQENWKAAIGIYQKMAKLEGPRAEEARARLSQLRLEKFIWD